ncbi:hypothetical protein SNE40_013317 [Patella caerulea]|uniref:Protein NATD1 n=1 Tax=Patella caerulea TaxID=87958 RepID=A0AAN8JM02_PATCE
MAYNVVHIKESNEFAITIINDSGGEEKAMLQYEFIKPNIVDLYHTEVPPVFRGKGIAKILAKEAIEHFMKEDVKLKLSCTYLQKYVDDNPKPEYSNGKIIF